MLVKEHQILGESCFDLLDRMTYMNESTIDPMMVAIVRNDRLGKDLIMMESFCKFAESNGIEDAGEAIAEVCKCNGIGTSDIGFYVEETSCIADDSLAETAQFFMENGYCVYAAPIQSTSVQYRALEEALELDKDIDDWSQCENLQAYCEENVLEKASNAIGGAKDAVVNKVSSNWKAAKATATSGIDDLSKKYAAAKKKVAELADKARRLAGDAKVACLKQLEKAKQVMKSIGQKLSSIKGK